MKFENTYVSNFEGAFRGMRNPLASWEKSDSSFGIKEDGDLIALSIADLWVKKLFPDLEFGSKEHWAKEEKYANWLFKNGTLKESSQGNFYETAWIGPNDMNLAQRLCAAGPEHRKFLRQIQVCVDITAPLYFFKEFDTYKVGTVANSTSTMHKLASTPITIDCFETDDYEPNIIFEEGIDETGDTPFDYHISIKDVVGEKEDNVYWPEATIIGFLESLRLKYNETKDKRYWKELVRWLPNGWLQTRTITMNYENIRSICAQRANHKLTEWHQFVDWAHTLPYADQLIFDQKVAFE